MDLSAISLLYKRKNKQKIARFKYNNETGGWSELHELQNEKHVRIYASPNIVRGTHIKDDAIGAS